MRFKIGDPVISNKLLIVLGSSTFLWPEEPGVVVEVNDDDGGLLVKFDGLPDAIGTFPEDVAAR